MATNAVTPPAAAAAPATPAAAPAATPAATPAPVATPAAQPAAAPAVHQGSTATPPAKKFEGMSTEEIVSQTLKERLKFDKDGNIANVEEATEHKPAEIERANDLSGTKVEEEPQVRRPAPEKTEEVKTEDKPEEKPADKAADKGGEAEEDDNPYVANEGIAAKDLRAEIDADPALKQAISANPKLRNQIFANARLAARVGEYEQIFISPAEAKVAAEAHGSYSMLSSLLGEVDYAKPETAQAFTRALIEQTYLRDEEGDVLKNAKGEPRSSGAVGRWIKSQFAGRLGNEMDMLEGQLNEARRAGDDDRVEEISRVIESMQTVAARFGLRPSAGADEDGMPEDVKRERAALKAQRDELDQREQRQREQSRASFEEGIAVDTQKVFDAELDKFLAKATGIDDHNRATTVSNIKRALEQSINANGTYATRHRRLMWAAETNGFTPKIQQKIVALNLEVMRDSLKAGVAKKALADAGAHVISRQEKADDEQAARADRARGDTRTALGASRPGAALTTEQLRANIAQELKAKTGEDPTQQEILQEQLLRGFAAHRAR